jgi:hypothetical protein
MPRPRAALRRARTAALAAALGGILLTLLGPAPGPAYAARAGEQTPLSVTISSLTPSTLVPRKGGLVTVTGTVTNTQDEAWQDVTVYPFISAAPMTTTAELAEAATTDESVEVGGRVLNEGDYARVGDIEPGASVPFTIVVRRDDLPASAPGVYWFGVHALGSGPDGADTFADGRARTFLPLLNGKATPTRTTLVVPLRVHVQRAADGSLTGVASWQRLLASTGRLGGLLRVATAPGGRTLSWLVDPGVLDAVRQLAAGNPPRDLGPTEDASGDGGESPSASPSPSATASDAAETASPETEAAAALAKDWLQRMVPVLKSSSVLGLPYGDIDLSAAASDGRDLYDTARTRSIALFDDLGIPATQVNAPPDGLISDEGLAMTDSATPMILSDAALPTSLTGGTAPAPAVVQASGWRVVATSSAAASGGPGPGDPLADVALRQRLLSEAAARSLDPAHPPLVVMLPARWRPSDPNGFLAGLDARWVQLTGLSSSTAGQLAPQIESRALRYPGSAAKQELSGSRFDSASALIRAGRSLQRVLSRNDSVAGDVVDEALTDVGYPARASSGDDAVGSRAWIEDRLDQVQVRPAAKVILSGASGKFAATVVNGLDQPVTVSLRPVTDAGIVITAPKTVEIAAAGRATVLLQARRARSGVHNVSLQLVDTDGERLGASAYVPIRVAQVSRIIWLFLAVGGALLFGAIAVRLFRRVRTARRGAAS